MKSIILILCLFTTINIFGDLHFGVKAGVNYNSIDKDSGFSNNITTQYNLNFSGGIFLLKEINEYIYISAEGLYNRKGFHSVYDTGGEEKYDSRTIVEYFEIPLLIGIKYMNIYFYSGIYWANYLNSVFYCEENRDICKSEIDGIYDKELESSDTGIILGLGYQLNRFLFDLRYSKGISDINVAPKGSDDYTGIDNFYQFIFSVGFMFK